MKELTLLLACLGCAAAVTVNTKYGDVVGQTWPLHNGKSVNSFLAIPFAKPPVGNLRFAKPEEPEPWSEPVVADTLGPACPQGDGLIRLTQPLWNRYSEDCLHMNVYTPQNMSEGPYPVMVWFHGGGYGGSANVQYPGYFLASRDVIVVVPNYRLGALGFISTNDDVAPGNWGLWDQNLALAFIQENIQSFGGDPTRVTLFGQSAGASSSGMHIVSPQSRGLFNRVIYESGSETTLWALNYPESAPENFTMQVAVQVGCPVNQGSAAMIACLREKTADEIREANVDCTPGWFCQGFGPVVDGEGGFLPKLPQEIRAADEHAKVDIIAGQCNKDGSLYTIGFIPEALDGGFNRTTFYRLLRERLIDIFAPRVDGNPQILADAEAAMNFQFTPWPHFNDSEENDQNRQAFNDMVTDVGFGYAQDRINKQQMMDNKNVYYYIMSYRSPQAAVLVPEWLGVPHNGEVPYVMGWTQIKLNPSLRFETEMYFDIIDWDEKDAEYADYVMDLWTNFARDGNPTSRPVMKPDGSGEATVWEPYLTPENMPYLDIDVSIKEKVNYRQKYFAFWQDYLPYVSGIDTLEAASSMFYGMQNESSTNIEEMIGQWVSEAINEKMSRA